MMPPFADAVVATAAGTLAYVTTAGISHAAQLAAGIHTGRCVLGVPLVPSVLGLCTVAAGSAAAVEASEIVLAAALFAQPLSAPILRERLAGIASASPFATEWRPPPLAPWLPAMLCGAASFIAMGGRFWALSPSSLSTLGAFANTRRGSLPATLSYATAAERAKIQSLGLRFGCHSCGTFTSGAARFIADHQPPLAEVKVANGVWWRRLLGREVAQRFYPHCPRCSRLQGQLLGERAALARALGSRAPLRLGATGAKTAARAAVPHWPSLLRPTTYAPGAIAAAAAAFAPDALAAADAALAPAVGAASKAVERSWREARRRIAVGVAAAARPPAGDHGECVRHGEGSGARKRAS